MSTPAFFCDLAFVDGLAASMYGEEIRISPTKDGRVDPSRPIMDITAIVGSQGARTIGLSGGFNMQITAEPMKVYIDGNACPELVLKRQDLIRFTNRRGEPWGEIGNVTRHHTGLIVAEVGSVG